MNTPPIQVQTMVVIPNFRGRREVMTPREAIELRDSLSIAIRNIAALESKIKSEVAAEFGIIAIEMDFNTRKEYIRLPRQVCMWLFREVCQMSFESIASRFGTPRDHKTAIHACNVVRRRMETSAEFNHRLNALKNRIIEMKNKAQNLCTCTD